MNCTCSLGFADRGKKIRKPKHKAILQSDDEQHFMNTVYIIDNYSSFRIETFQNVGSIKLHSVHGR